MARLGRKERILKWAGLIGSVLVAITWAVSLRWVLADDIQSGRFSFSAIQSGGFRWRPLMQLAFIQLPLWIPFLLFAIPTVYVWWRDRRIPPGHCRKCGYNLTGNVSGVCPECGERV
jgi:hypothetical protein